MKSLFTATVATLLLTSAAFAQTPLNKRPIRFVAVDTEPEPSSISQLVGVCDGTRSDTSFKCSMVHLQLHRDDASLAKIMKADPSQCVMQVLSGPMLTFKKQSENVWSGDSEPGFLCGRVDTYTLEADPNGVFWKVILTSKDTDTKMFGCRPSSEPSRTEYKSHLTGTLPCVGATLGPNPGF